MPKGNPMTMEECIKRRREADLRYYYRNKEKRIAYVHCWKKNNPKKTKLHKYASRKKCTESWEEYFSKEAKCQICGKKIFYNQNNRTLAISFDHKTGEEIIKDYPSSWLRNNLRSPESEKIWESCNFGILCNRCNRFLPTKNRKAFVRSIIKYLGGVE